MTILARVAERVPTSTADIGRWLGDALAIVVLVGALGYLARFDGGFPTEVGSLARVGLVALLAVGVAAAEAGRLPRPARVLLAAWGLGLLASLALGADRSSFEHPLLTYAALPIVALLARRLWGRSWGPPAVAAVLAGSFLWYWQEAFFAWWGWRMAGRPDAHWAALSWHNQSGMLMGAYGLCFLGSALLARRRIAHPAAVLTGMALGAAWLSGSRGAIAATALGVTVVVLVARREGWKRLGTRMAGAGILTALVVGGLLAMGPGSPAHPVAIRQEPAPEALRLRLDHMAAGLGMFTARPLTGHGPGSYRRTAPGFASPQVHLTAAAHSEPVEALAEGGLAFGGPFLVLLGGSGLLLLAAVRRGSPGRSTEGLRQPLAAGMAGAAAGLGIHMALDFDWMYPVLAFLLAVAMVGVEGSWSGWTSRGSVRGWGAVVPGGLALLVAVGAVWLPGTPPWQPVPRLQKALELSAQGSHAEGLDEIEGALAWNPGNASLQVGGALVRYRARLVSAAEVEDSLRPGRTGPALYNLAARVLLEGGDRTEAARVLERVVELYPRLHESRRPPSVVAETWVLRIRTEWEATGCDSARRLAARAAADPALGAAGPVEELRDYADRLCSGSTARADFSR